MDRIGLERIGKEQNWIGLDRKKERKGKEVCMKKNRKTKETKK